MNCDHLLTRRKIEKNPSGKHLILSRTTIPANLERQTKKKLYEFYLTIHCETVKRYNAVGRIYCLHRWFAFQRRKYWMAGRVVEY